MKSYICCLLILVGSFLFSSPIDENIKKLSFLERYYMKVFFDEAITKDQAAHVIFYNNKPVCLTGPAIKYRHKKFRDIISLKGWHAFKKHGHLFPHPNFIFTENLFGDSKNFKILHIYIINKTSLERCLNHHEALFKKNLGPLFEISSFIAQLEQGHSLLSLLHKNEMLLGILLGYGKESSKAFSEVLKKCTDDYAPPPTETYQRIDLDRPENCTIHPVVFMGNPHSEEVQSLKTTYEKELKKFWPEYKYSKRPLKTVLEGLCK